MRFAALSLAAVLSVSPFAFPSEHRAMADQAGKSAVSTPATPPAGVTLAEINDHRAESFARVRLSFVIPDLLASEVRGQRVLLKEAKDDGGASLVPEGAADAEMEENRGALAIGAAKEPATFEVELKSPARSSKSLKVVSGEVEMYVPGRDPGSAVTIPKFASQDGRPLSAPVLSANGIVITILGKNGFAAERKAAGAAARKAALADRDSAEEAGEKAASAEKYFLSNYDPRYHTVLKVKDPKGRIGSYSFVDPQGKEGPASSMLFSGYMFLTHGPDEVGPATSLRIQLKTPKNILRRPFNLKDVPLP
jgi:hypothetical protein